MLQPHHRRVQALLREHSGKRGPEGGHPGTGGWPAAPLPDGVVLKVSGALPNHGVLEPVQITLGASRAYARVVEDASMKSKVQWMLILSNFGCHCTIKVVHEMRRMPRVYLTFRNFQIYNQFGYAYVMDTDTGGISNYNLVDWDFAIDDRLWPIDCGQKRQYPLGRSEDSGLHP